MDLIHLINPLYALSGMVVGMVVGFTGIGGGSLMTPLLVLVFHIHPGTAVGTDLIYAGFTNAAGTAGNGFRASIDWGIVGRLAAGSVPAALVTVLLLAHFHAKAETGHGIITSVLGAALILSAVCLLFRRIIVGFFSRRSDGAGGSARRGWLTVLLGLALGVLVSISSVGAGAIGMTVLLILYPKAPAARLVGADIAHAVPLTLIAGLGHWWMGTVDWSLLISLLSGSIPGILIGSYFASRAPDRVLRPLLASTLAIVGGKMFF
jgi:hypothetical protein